MTFEQWWNQNRDDFLHLAQASPALGEETVKRFQAKCWNDALMYFKSFILLQCCTSGPEPLSRANLASTLHAIEEHLRGTNS
jgi:hypothetical protein